MWVWGVVFWCLFCFLLWGMWVSCCWVYIFCGVLVSVVVIMFVLCKSFGCCLGCCSILLCCCCWCLLCWVSLLVLVGWVVGGVCFCCWVVLVCWGWFWGWCRLCWEYVFLDRWGVWVVGCLGCSGSWVCVWCLVVVWVVRWWILVVRVGLCLVVYFLVWW